MTIFAPIGWKTGAPAVASIVKQAHSTSSAANITAPADIIAGDLLVLADLATTGFGTPASVTPTGFTLIDERSSTISLQGIKQAVSYKIATGSEASTSITGMDGGTTDNKVLVVYRPDVPATSVTVVDIGAEITAGNPASQTVNASGGVAPLIVLGLYGSEGTINPRTFSPAKDGEANLTAGSVDLYQAWKIYNSSPADVTIDMDDEGDWNVLQSCYIQLA